MYDMLPEKLYGTFFTVMAIVAASYVLRSVCNYIMTTGDIPSVSEWKRI